MMTVAVMGLGTMGGRIAKALAASGHAVQGYDPVADARERASSAGLHVSDTAEDALYGATFVVLSVPRPEHVLETVAGPLTSLTSGTVADLSTIDPGTARQAHTTLAAHGVGYVDCPVLGRPDRIGGWTLPAGGSPDDIAAVRAVLVPSVASKVIEAGDVGAGSVVKVLNNLMFGAINAITAEALTACRLAGVDPEIFVSTLADSGAATVSNLFRELGPKMVAADYSPVFSLDLLSKDNRLALDLARTVGASAPLAEAIVEINREAVELGYGRDDTGAVFELYRSRSSDR